MDSAAQVLSSLKESQQRKERKVPVQFALVSQLLELLVIVRNGLRPLAYPAQHDARTTRRMIGVPLTMRRKKCGGLTKPGHYPGEMVYLYVSVRRKNRRPAIFHSLGKQLSVTYQ